MKFFTGPHVFTAFVKKMTQDPVTGETKATVAARLTKGHSFGVSIISVRPHGERWRSKETLRY